MIFSNKCVICDSGDIQKFPAAMSPFFARRAFGDTNVHAELVKCSNCDFTFYNPRLEIDEINKLYNGYRDEQYQVQRQEFEPWYTSKINQMIGKNEIELKERKENLKNILSRNTDVLKIQSVLDYGGDRGQFIIDELINAKKYVYEISNVIPLEGVHIINEIDDSVHYDLVMCCHVLEHYSYPRELIETLVPLIGERGLLYIELPSDDPTRTGSKSRLRNWLNLLMQKSPYLARVIMRISNRFAGTMHEHINHFSLESLEYLLTRQNLVVIEKFEKTIDCGWTKGKIICFLAKVKI